MDSSDWEVVRPYAESVLHFINGLGENIGLTTSILKPALVIY